MKTYDAWQELKEWLLHMDGGEILTSDGVLDKIDELECKHE